MIPKRLHRNNRPVDPNFSDEEVLFRRVKPDITVYLAGPDVKINPDVFDVKNMSVNRGNSSQAEDVLYNTKSDIHYEDHKIVYIQAGHVQNHKQTHAELAQICFSFKCSHEPEALMYPHTEIHTFQNETERKEKIQSHKTRDQYKKYLASKAKEHSLIPGFKLAVD